MFNQNLRTNYKGTIEPSAIIVKNLTVAYNGNPVLQDININIPKGKLVAMIGPNGAGKTTLLKSLLNIIKPLYGTVEFPLLKNKKWHNQVAYVPQSGSVDWDFPTTVLDVVMMGRYGYLGWFKRPGNKEKEMAMEVLKKVGMDSLANRQIGQLSGGQQQRVFLARALVQEAEIYLLDEPFKGVDAQTEWTIISLLKELRDQGKTVMVVHHDLDTVDEYFDWGILINKRVIVNGPIKDVFNKENLHTTYHSQELPWKQVS